MANNSKLSLGKRTLKQIVYSQPRKVLIGKYISAKGLRLIQEGVLTKEQADKKYGRNRYGINPDAKPIRTITHKLDPHK